MAPNAYVRARIDEKLKAEATAVLADMGLTVSGLVHSELHKWPIEHCKQAASSPMLNFSGR